MPFFLSPDATLWHALRTGEHHPRLSAGAREADPYDFVFLVSTVKHSSAPARRSWSPTATRRAPPPGSRSAGRTPNACFTGCTPWRRATLEAELLVEEPASARIGHPGRRANDKVRQRVRDLLAGSDFSPRSRSIRPGSNSRNRAPSVRRTCPWSAVPRAPDARRTTCPRTSTSASRAGRCSSRRRPWRTRPPRPRIPCRAASGW